MQGSRDHSISAPFFEKGGFNESGVGFYYKSY